MTRRTPVRFLMPLLCLPALAACELEDAMMSGGTGTPQTIAQQCVAKAARDLRTSRDGITVISALSVPEGDIVKLSVPGEGTIGCNADVDGVIGPLLRLDDGSVAAAPTAATPPA